jgi:transcription initiation factor IIF auxiliary subunit
VSLFPASTTDGPATTDAALAALAAEAGLIDPESPIEASVSAENDLFHAEKNGHAEELLKGIETRGNPGDDAGGTSGNSQGGDQGGNEGTSGNPSENPDNSENLDGGEENVNGGGNAGNPGGDPPPPGGYGGFPDSEYLAQQNEEEEEEEEEEVAQMEQEHADDVTQNITENLLDIPLPFSQNPLNSDVSLPQNPADGQAAGDLENQVTEAQSAAGQSDFNQAVPVLSSYGDINSSADTDTADTPTVAEEDAPQETEPDVDENVCPNNPESPGQNVGSKDGTDNEGEVGISGVQSLHEGNVDDKDNGNQVQTGQQLVTGNSTLEEGLLANASQSQGETADTNNAEESQATIERAKESSENTKRNEQSLLTVSQAGEDKLDAAQVKTEQLDDIDADSDALATLASAALGCDQAATNGVKADLQVRPCLCKHKAAFF